MDDAALDRAIVELITSDQVKVPPYPAVAAELGAVLAKGAAGAERVASVVQADQSLAATVLAYANSARFGAAGPAASLRQAIVRIGTDELVRVAWAASLGAAAVRAGPLLDLRHLVWRQAVTSAHLCHQLASGRGVPADEAFTCGLLHRFGRTVALGCLEQILERGDPGAALPASQWMGIVDRYEVELGLVTATVWGLPESVARVISVHRTPELGGAHRDLAELVAASDEIVELLEAETVVTEERLAACRHVGGRAELSLLLRVLPALPSIIRSLIPESAASTRGSMVRPSAAASPGGPEPPLDLPVTVAKARGEIEFRATAMTRDGMTMTGPAQLAVNSLVMLELPAGEKRLTFWATVQRCEERPAGGAEVEVRLFGSDAATRQRWAELARNPRPAHR